MPFQDLAGREITMAFALTPTPEYPQQIGFRLRNSNGHPGFRGPGKVSLNKLVRLGIAEKTGFAWDIRYRRGPRWPELNAMFGAAQTGEELANLDLFEKLKPIFSDLPRPSNVILFTVR